MGTSFTLKELWNNLNFNMAVYASIFILAVGVLSAIPEAASIDVTSLPQFNNHAYYSPGPTYRSHNAANDDCKSYGGYLAEINDEAEFKFVSSLFNQTNIKVELGEVDERQNGQWKGMTSGDAMTYFNWYPGTPAGRPGFNCLWMQYDSSKGGWLMYDMKCYASFIVQYVC